MGVERRRAWDGCQGGGKDQRGMSTQESEDVGGPLEWQVNKVRLLATGWLADWLVRWLVSWMASWSWMSGWLFS